jgi:adenosine deaminase
MNNLKDLPKVELHSHLDCSLSFDAIQQLNPTVTREEYREKYVAPSKCRSLDHYLQCTLTSVKLLQTHEALEIAVADLFKQLMTDNVIYTEIRFAPLLHTEKGLTPEKVVEVVETACTRYSKETGIESRIILCTLRHFTSVQSMRTVKLVHEFQGTRVAILDLAGSEAGFPLDEHEAAFQYAVKHGIPRIVHTGEALGAHSVWETLKKLKPARIGHGIRSIKDPVLMTYLQEHNIHLEICPTCNVQTDVVSTYPEHPVNQIYQSGVPISISTDTRGITNITLTEEYEKLSDVFGWEPGDFLTCNLNALEAAFLPSDIKNDLVKKLHSGYIEVLP